MVRAAAYLLPLGYFAWSLRYGKPAGDDPWDATGLEWRTRSPPPTENFETQPVVSVGPYDYHDPAEAVHGRSPRSKQGAAAP